MKWWIPITITAAVAAFLFIDHRHTFLLPEALYCSLGLSSSDPFGRDFGRSVICWKCPGMPPHPLEPFCTYGWWSEELPCPDGIKPVFNCPSHYSVWGGLTKKFEQLTKGVAGNPHHN